MKAALANWNDRISVVSVNISNLRSVGDITPATASEDWREKE